MSQYAVRDDGVRVKIGTCETMYYLRFEDREKVRPTEGSAFGAFYRLPYPDEDNVKPGEYELYDRFEPLPGFTLEGIDPEKNAGIIQAKAPGGVLISLHCYHGLKLPLSTNEVRIFWNGKDPDYFVLRWVRLLPGPVLKPVVGCKYCGALWRCEWDEVLPYVQNPELRHRLEVYKTLSLKHERG